MSQQAPWLTGDQDARWDGYFNEHGLLVNLSDPPVTTQAQLDAFEAAHSSVAAIELRLQPVDGNFDLEHLQAIHRRLAGKIYPFAGELRSVDIAKGSIMLEDGAAKKAGFIPHQHIRTYMRSVTEMLRDADYLRGLDSDIFAARLAHYFNAINYAHPFREMNGRTSREFWTQLAHQAGHTIDWRGISAEENIVVSHQARTRGELEPLREALQRITSPLRGGARPATASAAVHLASLGYATPAAAVAIPRTTAPRYEDPSPYKSTSLER